MTVWTDPEFDASQQVFYYARVPEIPTPRWAVYDAVRFGVEIPADAVTTGPERAYTSTIWYAPEGRSASGHENRAPSGARCAVYLRT